MPVHVFRLPDIGEGIAEAEISAWHVKVGDRIEEDQPLVDVMTDKATVDVASPVAGRIAAIHGEIGERVPVGSPLVEFEIAPDRIAAGGAEAAQIPDPSDEAPLASPATRKRARDLGIALQSVPGTGPDGRITGDDLDVYLHRDHGDEVSRQEAGDEAIETKIVGLRRKIAEKMEAANRIPHFSYIEEFDLTELEELRRELNADQDSGRPKLTLLPFIMRGVAKLIPEYPQFNAHYDEEAGILRSFKAVHIGIATRTAGGLMVPVVRHAEALDVWGCARELGRVTLAARDGKARREELSGSTITVSSLGTLGGIAATPVINHPEVAILGPNKLVDRPVARGGRMIIRTVMNLSSSFDHRIIDGHEAARFVQDLKRMLERPGLLFLDVPKRAVEARR
jgi:2-oxoisovalerate dehydrogenase E2 component (dihydrolipoyl transacylase)